MSNISSNAPAYRFSSLRAELSTPAQTTPAGNVGTLDRLDLPRPAGFGTPDTYPDIYTLAKPPQGRWGGMSSIRGGSSGGVWDNLGQAASRMGAVIQETPAPGGPAADAQARMGSVIQERSAWQHTGELTVRLENQKLQLTSAASPETAAQTRMIKEVELPGAGGTTAAPQGAVGNQGPGLPLEERGMYVNGRPVELPGSGIPSAAAQGAGGNQEDHRAASDAPMNPGVIRGFNPQPDPPG